MSGALAYVFWHRPAPGTDAEAYEALQRAFQAALAADPPAGFLGAAVHRLDAAPWLPGDGPAYEDWYRVEDWAALGALEGGAVSGSRRRDHDAVAHASGTGAGAVYRHRRGPADGLGAVARWGGASGDGAVWQRALVLGPAPEWVTLGAEGPGTARTRLA